MSERLAEEGRRVAEAAAAARRLMKSTRCYVEARRGSGATLDDLLAILEGYNSPWDTLERWRPPRELPGLIVTLGGDDGVREMVDLASNPALYRLNFIKQLSTTHMWTNLDGSHNRLSHSLGTVQCAWWFLDSIRRENQEYLNPRERRAVLLLALIHDYFHGPLGHSLETLRDVFSALRYKKLDKYYLQEALTDATHPINRAITGWLAPEERDGVLSTLRVISDADFCCENDPDKYFLAQIVDSLVDADRIDYVVRDARHLGAEHPSEKELLKLVQGVRVKRARDEKAHEKVATRRLCFNIEHRHIVDDLLTKRAQMYDTFYEEPRKTILDEMLVHAVYYSLEYTRVLAALEADDGTSLLAEQVLSQIMRLTDHDLLRFLCEIAGPELGARFHVVQLLHDIVTNNVWAEIDRKEVDSNDIEGALGRIDRLEQAFADELEKARERRFGRLKLPSQQIPIEDQGDILRRLVAAAGWGNPATLMYFALVLGGGFYNKHAVEKSLWSALLKRADFAEAFDNYLFASFENDAAQAAASLQDVPHIHLSLRPYAGRTAASILARARERGAEERVAYYSRNGEVVFELPDVAVRRSDRTWTLIASAPHYFADTQAARQAIVEELDRLVFVSADWLAYRMV